MVGSEQLMATAQELATELFQLRSQIEVFKRKADEVEAELLAEMPEKKLEVPGIGVFESRKATDRKQWQHAELQSTLIAKIRSGEARTVDPETGEIVEEDDVALTARVFTATANPSWRVTALKALDINPDEYCFATPGKWSVQFYGQLDEEVTV